MGASRSGDLRLTYFSEDEAAERLLGRKVGMGEPIHIFPYKGGLVVLSANVKEDHGGA